MSIEIEPSIETSLPFPPDAIFGDVELPGTRLHYVKCGSGPPLVIIPATVSLIRQWLPLAQFMGQRFTTYFFELPGHGKSTPYPGKFESQLVPKTVEAFVDAMGHSTFSLMGFSFGGLLALRTLEHLENRIERIILLSPSLSHRALKFSAQRQWAVKTVMGALKKNWVQQSAHQIMNAPKLEKPLVYAISKASKVEKSILENKKALRMPQSTLDVFAYTVDEIFHMEYHSKNGAFKTPCFFGMSINDDLLDYELTEEIVSSYFSNLKVQKFSHPYHQPPEPPTFEWLWREFHQFLELIE